MFGRRKESPPSPAARLESLRTAGYTVAEGGAEIRRGSYFATLAGTRLRAGILIGGEPAYLVDAGYQKFFETAAGRRRPALAEELAALHRFEEELKHALNLPGPYNEALGTTSVRHRYDRLAGR
jgi:hypothetical protein